MEGIGALQSETTSIPRSEGGSEMIAKRDIEQEPSPPSPRGRPIHRTHWHWAILQTVREGQLSATPALQTRPRSTFERPVQEGVRP